MAEYQYHGSKKPNHLIDEVALGCYRMVEVHGKASADGYGFVDDKGAAQCFELLLCVR